MPEDELAKLRREIEEEEQQLRRMEWERQKAEARAEEQRRLEGTRPWPAAHNPSQEDLFSAVR